MQGQYNPKEFIKEWWGVLLALTMIMSFLCVIVHYSERIPKEEKHEPIVFVGFIIIFLILEVFTLAICGHQTESHQRIFFEEIEPPPANSEEDDNPNLTCPKEHYE
jgi:hypothetical protein